MPETRRRNYRTITPPLTKRREYNTPKKAQFYNDYDMRSQNTSIREVERKNNIGHATALRWIKERQILGSPAKRGLRKKSLTLGRKSQVSREQCQTLINPETNPVRDQHYEAQIEYFNMQNSITGDLISTRILRRSLRRYIKNAQRFK